jgi:hypothetical protein
MRSRSVLITAALLLAGALGVHELRYLLAFGGGAESALAHDGHGYLMLLMPLLATLSALGLAAGLVHAAAAPAVRSATLVRFGRLWPAASAALLAIYVGQELLEGLLAPGHPSGWAGAFGSGGWVAVPLAFAFGAVVALALRVARAVRAAPPLRIAAVRLELPTAPAHAAAPPLAPRRSGRLLAEHLAGRAPPVHFV